MSKLLISWTMNGDLRVDDIAEDQPKLHVKFFDWRRLPNAEKVRLLRAILDAAPAVRAVPEGGK